CPAEQILQANVAADQPVGPASPLRRPTLAWLLADRGALAPARAVAIELTEHGRAHHNPFDEGRGHWVLAEVLRRAGELDAAEREVQAALAQAVPLERPSVLATLAALRLAQGRAEDAITAAEDATAQCAA